MFVILMRRSAKAILNYSVEILVAVILLQYSMKWFLLFWFVQTIFSNERRYEANRCLLRVYQFGNESKIHSIMTHLGLNSEDAAKRYLEELKAEMTAEDYKKLEQDFIVAGL